MINENRREAADIDKPADDDVLGRGVEDEDDLDDDFSDDDEDDDGEEEDDDD